MHCPGNIRLFCPPLPPMHAASPPCGHPAGTQRVQRLRQCSVAGGSSGDSFAALASVGSARAACPFPLAYTRRGMPHSGRFCRAPGIVGSVSRRCCGDRVFHRYAFFLCRSRKKREVLSIKHNNPIEGRRKRRLFPSINIIIFNTGTHASAPSGRHSCRRERSSSPPCPGLGHFLPASPGCVRCASTARCAACRPAKPWVMSAEAANTFPTGFAGRCRTLRKPVGQSSGTLHTSLRTSLHTRRAVIGHTRKILRTFFLFSSQK